MHQPACGGVYKFRSQGQLYLLGYSVDDAVRLVCLEAMGLHDVRGAER